MRQVLTVLEGHDERSVVAAAVACARMMDARAVVVRPGEGGERRRVDDVLKMIDSDEVVAAAISAAADDDLSWEDMAGATKPLLIVPPGAAPRPRIHRILLPLDGDPRTAAGVEEVVQLATACGIAVYPLHVFDASTAPAFWDQAAHTHAAWTEEFLRRNVPAATEMGLRHGEAADEVLDAAATEEVDLVVIGWGHSLGEGRAQVVRRAVTEGRAPVLLLGVGRG